MIPIKIVEDRFVIKSIEAEDLTEIVKCINQSEDNLRTLAIDGVLTYKDMRQRYIETLMNSLEYFCGIYINNKLVGIIKGRIENKVLAELWILSIIFLEEYRNKGIGTEVLVAIEKNFYNNYRIKHFCTLVINNNTRAKSFWEKNGYNLVRAAKVESDENSMNAMIFEKYYK